MHQGLKLQVHLAKVERREYERRNGGGRGVAHQVNVVTPDGDMGQVFLGGDSDQGRTLYAKAEALAGQGAYLVYGASTYQGRLELRPVDVVALK